MVSSVMSIMWNFHEAKVILIMLIIIPYYYCFHIFFTTSSIHVCKTGRYSKKKKKKYNVMSSIYIVLVTGIPVLTSVFYLTNLLQLHSLFCYV